MEQCPQKSFRGSIFFLQKYKFWTKRNFSTYCCIRLPLNFYELKTSLFSRLGFPQWGKCFSLYCFVTLDHLPFAFPFLVSHIVQRKRFCEPLFFPILVTVIYISSPFHCSSPWIRQACSNLRFTLKVTESPLTWQRLCMTRTSVLGGDPLVWAGAFNLGDARRLGGISLLFQSVYSFRTSWNCLW